ncbi:uncharacterized protein LOC131208354 isoform X2 [Anopheles bellator]|nr:uncharacterized protein LOC131208354 isoform X2 [Anopheles bellator]
MEVLFPKGIRLWTHYNPDTAVFGVELYVKYYGGQTEALECGLCRNTSRPVFGKFMLQDDNVVARVGDVLEYTIITSDGTTSKRHAVRRKVIDDQLIRHADQCDSCPGSSTVLLREPQSEAEMLERMILRVLTNPSCESLSQWLVMKVEPRNELANVEEHVRTVLARMLRVAQMLDPVGSSFVFPGASELIEQVEDHPDGIAFRVTSTIAKLKLFEVLRSSGLVGDYDEVL